MDGAQPLDVGGALLRGTLVASMIIALLLILFLRRDFFSGLDLGDFFSKGFGWFR